MRLSLRSSSALRAGAVGLVVLAASGLGLQTAHAAPTDDVVLDSAATTLSPWPQENFGGPTPIDTDAAEPTPTPIDVAWGGSVTVTLPAQLVDGGGMEVSLALSPDGVSSDATKTYSTATADLTVTALGGNQFQVDMPADDGVNGPRGDLTFTGFAIAGGVDVTEADGIAPYQLQLSGGGPATVSLAPQLHVSSRIPDATMTPPATTVPAGGVFDVVLPPTSRLSQLGIPDLATSDFGLIRDNGSGGFVPAPAPSVLRYSDAGTVTVGIPAGLPAGDYRLEIVIGDGTDAVWASLSVAVRVAALNDGLLSETGGDERAPSVPAGAYLAGGLVLAVLAGGAVRFRRSTQG